MKVMHADSHTLFREGIHHILKQADADLEFLEAPTLQIALDVLTRRDDIDLVLLDPDLAGLDSFVVFKKLWDSNPTVPIVILSAAEDPVDIEAAIDMGAAGYIPKSATGQTLIGALKLVLDGGIYAPRIRTYRNGQARANNGADLQSDLTKRQREVLALIAEGLSNKAIARKLFVSEATIKGHVTAILSVLQVNNRVQAINKARQYRHGFGTMMAPMFDASFSRA